MYLKKDLEKDIKNKIKNNQIVEAIDLLENEIKLEYISRIRKFNNKVSYIDLIDLKDNVERYLQVEERKIFKKFFAILNCETNELYQLERLTEIYKKLMEGEK